MNSLNHAHRVGRVMTKSEVAFKDAKEVQPGDVIVDRAGNEMVVVEVLDHSTGECLALFNGVIKRISASRVSMVVPKARSNE